MWSYVVFFAQHDEHFMKHVFPIGMGAESYALPDVLLRQGFQFFNIRTPNANDVIIGIQHFVIDLACLHLWPPHSVLACRKNGFEFPAPFYKTLLPGNHPVFIHRVKAEQA